MTSSSGGGMPNVGTGGGSGGGTASMNGNRHDVPSSASALPAILRRRRTGGGNNHSTGEAVVGDTNMTAQESHPPSQPPPLTTSNPSSSPRVSSPSNRQLPRWISKRYVLQSFRTIIVVPYSSIHPEIDHALHFVEEFLAVMLDCIETTYKQPFTPLLVVRIWATCVYLLYTYFDRASLLHITVVSTLLYGCLWRNVNVFRLIPFHVIVRVLSVILRWMIFLGDRLGVHNLWNDLANLKRVVDVEQSKLMGGSAVEQKSRLAAVGVAMKHQPMALKVGVKGLNRMVDNARHGGGSHDGLM